jgi:hypothetical protein
VRAFAGDEVVQEFEQDKMDTVEDEGDQVVDNTLPGTRSWFLSKTGTFSSSSLSFSSNCCFVRVALAFFEENPWLVQTERTNRRRTGPDAQESIDISLDATQSREDREDFLLPEAPDLCLVVPLTAMSTSSSDTGTPAEEENPWLVQTERTNRRRTGPDAQESIDISLDATRRRLVRSV